MARAIFVGGVYKRYEKEKNTKQSLNFSTMQGTNRRNKNFTLKRICRLLTLSGFPCLHSLGIIARNIACWPKKMDNLHGKRTDFGEIKTEHFLSRDPSQKNGQKK